MVVWISETIASACGVVEAFRLEGFTKASVEGFVEAFAWVVVEGVTEASVEASTPSRWRRYSNPSPTLTCSARRLPDRTRRRTVEGLIPRTTAAWPIVRPTWRGSVKGSVEAVMEP